MPRTGEHYADRGLFHLSGSLALVGLSWGWGGMAELAAVKEYNVFKVPDALTDEEAALVEPTAVAVYACDRGRVAAGNSVLVTGAGPIGALVLLAARAAGAAPLFVSDVNDARLDFVRAMLPDVVTINPSRRSRAMSVRRHRRPGRRRCRDRMRRQ
ncbi:MAG: hypothetical protein R3D25_05975 [Geminicoccaceae bacterium]